MANNQIDVHHKN